MLSTPNLPHFEDFTKISWFIRFKKAYGIFGYFLFAILIYIFWTTLNGVINDLGMYARLTEQEFNAIMSTIMPFETFTSFIIIILTGTAVIYFFKLNRKALQFALYYLVSYPIFLSIVEFGYSKDMKSIFGLLVGAAILLLIFWHFYKNDIQRLHPFLKKNIPHR